TRAHRPSALGGTRACFSHRIAKDGQHDPDIHSVRQDRRNLASVSQPGSAGGKETAQQPARGQLLQPRLPVLGVAAQPLEDPGQLTGDHGFALAEQPPGVLHQEQVIAQRESFEHPTSPGPPPDPAAPAGANDCPGSQNPRRPPRRFPHVPRTDARSSFYAKPSSAPDLSGASQTFRVTHPFHPLCGREFTLVTYRRDWGGHRVYFHGDTGRLASLPAQWTSLFPVDPFVAVSAGRSPFRIQDLLELSQLIARIRQGGAS